MDTDKRGIITANTASTSGNSVTRASGIAHETDHILTFESRNRRQSASKKEAIEDETSAYKVTGAVIRGNGLLVSDKALEDGVTKSTNVWCRMARAEGC